MDGVKPDSKADGAVLTRGRRGGFPGPRIHFALTICGDLAEARTARNSCIAQRDTWTYYQGVDDLRWTYMSPPPGGIAPGEPTGRYEIAQNTIGDREANSTLISMEDYAVAVRTGRPERNLRGLVSNPDLPLIQQSRGRNHSMSRPGQTRRRHSRTIRPVEPDHKPRDANSPLCAVHSRLWLLPGRDTDPLIGQVSCWIGWIGRESLSPSGLTLLRLSSWLLVSANTGGSTTAKSRSSLRRF